MPNTLPSRPRSDDDIERELEAISRWMDGVFEIPGLGWRFGLDAILGLVPGIGDFGTSLVSLYILAMGSRLGVPRITIARMALNVAIDYLIGSLPIVGDIFDVWWKSNQRNVALLKRRTNLAGTTARRASTVDWLFVGVVILLLGLVLLGSIVLAWYLVAAIFHGIAALLTQRS